MENKTFVVCQKQWLLLYFRYLHLQYWSSITQKWFHINKHLCGACMYQIYNVTTLFGRSVVVLLETALVHYTWMQKQMYTLQGVCSCWLSRITVGFRLKNRAWLHVRSTSTRPWTKWAPVGLDHCYIKRISNAELLQGALFIPTLLSSNTSSNKNRSWLNMKIACVHSGQRVVQLGTCYVSTHNMMEREWKKQKWSECNKKYEKKKNQGFWLKLKTYEFNT